MSALYQYTRNIGSLFQNAVSQAKTFYCREDFEDVIKRYKKAPKDAKGFIEIELNAMCEAKGIEREVILKNPDALAAIPVRRELLEQLQQHFVETFYNLHNDIPSAHDYMKRIVYRLAPEYQNDTVRVAILKKFVLGAGADCKVYDISAIVEWAFGRMGESEKKQYEAGDDQTKLKMVVQSLEDSIFDKDLRSTELSWREILLLIKKRDERMVGSEVITPDYEETEYPKYEIDCCAIAPGIRTFLGVEGKASGSAVEIIDALISKMDYAAEPVATEGEEEVLALPTESDLEEFAASLEKGFRKHLKQFTYRTKKGTIAKLIEKYKDDRDYAITQKQTGDWTLVTLCEDLAQGAFKTNNRQTRVHLYHFAMMFHMTFSKKREDMDPDTDIRKNLFEDYYCDNLMRYLGQSPLNLKEASGWEKEPSGEGINWKNYAEAIYLYYLYHGDNPLTAGQRINCAEQKIMECKKAAAKKGKVLPNQYTQYYTDVFFDVILNAQEKDLCGLILSYYPIQGNGATPIQKASQQITALEFFDESLEYLDDGREADYATGDMAKDRADQMDEIAAATSISFDWRIAALLKERYHGDTDFIRLLEKLEKRLAEEFDWVTGRKKAVLALVLQALHHHSSGEDPIKMEKLKKIIQKRDRAVNGALILEAAEMLSNLGFDVHRLSGKGESLFFLGERNYSDDTMNRIMKKVQTRYEPDLSGLRKLFAELLAEQENTKKTVTRTTVLSLCLSHYVEMLLDIEHVHSFVNLYDDFSDYVNAILEDCRFQPLHEKNILDMYIILSLFLYVTENGRK